MNREAEPTQPVACKSPVSKSHDGDIALRGNDFYIQSLFTKEAFLKRQIEVKKVEAFSRIADENFLRTRRRDSRETQRDQNESDQKPKSHCLLTAADGVME